MSDVPRANVGWGRPGQWDIMRPSSTETAMLPDPLHPAVVHFPVVLAFLLPIFAIGALIMIRRGARPHRAWSIPLALAAALALSSWVAVETGEQQSERVERVVADEPLDTHEEAAEAFLTGSVVLLLVVAAGLAPGLIGKAARGVAAAGTVALVVGAAFVGHSGGQLVYKHGAASAYASPPGASMQAAGEVAGSARDGYRERDHER